MKTIVVFFSLLSILYGCKNPGNVGSSSVHQNNLKDTSSISKTIPANDTGANGKIHTTDNSSDLPKNNKENINVIYATSQVWHGGIKGSGGGTNYEICITSDYDAKLDIDQLWIGQTSCKFTLRKKSPANISVNLAAYDTITIFASEYHKDPGFNFNKEDSTEVKNKPEATITTTPPYAYSGAALLGYKFGGLRMYKTISTFQRKPPLNYP